MKWLYKIGFVLALWVYFTLGCIAAPFLAIALVFPGVWRFEYARTFVKSADRMCAALLGFSGRTMLSTEVVFSNRRDLAWIRKGLDLIEVDHCEKSVYAEGPYCRLSDHEIRCK